MDVLYVQQRLRELADPEQAQNLQRYFKTSPGGYGEGDRFLGLRVPVLRKVAREFRGLPLPEVQKLLVSPFHEERLVALLLLVQAFSKGDASLRTRIYNLYLSHTEFVNNWDLVDTSAEHIVGAYLWDRNRDPLHALARSPLLWERRIAIMATFHYIKKGSFDETLRLSAMLVNDREDLIHKAVGWMLREIGERDRACEEAFLQRHYETMPRTMLRYAIEKFPEALRQQYLKGDVVDPTSDGPQPIALARGT